MFSKSFFRDSSVQPGLRTLSRTVPHPSLVFYGAIIIVSGREAQHCCLGFLFPLSSPVGLDGEHGAPRLGEGKVKCVGPGRQRFESLFSSLGFLHITRG